MRKVSVMLMVGLVMVWVSGVSAAILSVDGTTVVDDNFENASEVSHTPWTSGDTVDADPDNPQVGSWIINEGAPNVTQVSDCATSGEPGAAEGNNYLRIHRGSSSYPPAYLIGNSFTSGVAHLEVMVYAKTTDQNSIGLRMVDYTDADNIKYITSISFDDSGYIQYYSGGYHSTGIQYVAGEWKKLELDWVVGESTYSLTYNGQTKTNIPVRDASGSINGIMVADSWGSPGSYVDAVPVPEPATIGLLAMGAFGFIRRK